MVDKVLILLYIFFQWLLIGTPCIWKGMVIENDISNPISLFCPERRGLSLDTRGWKIEYFLATVRENDLVGDERNIRFSSRIPIECCRVWRAAWPFPGDRLWPREGGGGPRGGCPRPVIMTIPQNLRDYYGWKLWVRRSRNPPCIAKWNSTYNLWTGICVWILKVCFLSLFFKICCVTSYSFIL